MPPSPDLTGASSGSCGYVYAASGDTYVAAALEAARTLRAVCPDAAIDLFADFVPEGCDDVFDRVVPLERSWFRPKFEALQRSRFDRTLYLDTDTIALADPSDIFDVLERFDVVGAHNSRRNNDGALRIINRAIPNAFPQINGGVLGLRRSVATDAFIAAVLSNLDAGQKRDQPAIREFLFESDLRIWVLPPEYNMMYLRHVDALSASDAAPRILHMQRLHHHIRKGKTRMIATDLGSVVGARRLARLERLLANDASLGGRRTADLSKFLSGPKGRFWRFVNRHFSS